MGFSQIGMSQLATMYVFVPFAVTKSGVASRQMAAAYRHYLEPPNRLDWDFVVERHKAIQYDRNKQVIM